jgi:ABC-type molybdenum transport system ATPase subunit/photorepair protein PhrA
VRAPAKVNLALSVGRLRPDGFHDLTTVFQAVGLHDEVTLTRADELSVTVTDGPGASGAADVPLDATNLAVRAVALVAAKDRPRRARRRVDHQGHPGRRRLCGRLRRRRRGARRRRRAVGDGPGEGRAHRPRRPARQRRPVLPARRHGARAPAAASSSPRSSSAATTPGCSPSPRAGLSTPAVYAELDRQRDTGPVGVASSPDAVLSALRQGDAVALGRALGNDLQPAALRAAPALRPVLDAARSLGALGASCPGSGADRRRPGARRGPRRRAGRRADAARALAPTCAAPSGPSAAPRRGGRLMAVNLVNLENATVAHGTRLLLDRVSLGISEGDRIGVVGRNGGGKTTLLKTLVKAEEPHSGRVTHTSGLRVGVLTQDVRVDVALTAHAAVLGETAEHTWAGDARVREVLDGLGLHGIGLDSVIGTMSGGERRRVALASLLVQEWDLLVLDEPTNHLDVEGVAWLAAT